MSLLLSPFHEMLTFDVLGSARADGCLIVPLKRNAATTIIVLHGAIDTHERMDRQVITESEGQSLRAREVDRPVAQQNPIV